MTREEEAIAEVLDALRKIDAHVTVGRWWYYGRSTGVTYLQAKYGSLSRRFLFDTTMWNVHCDGYGDIFAPHDTSFARVARTIVLALMLHPRGSWRVNSDDKLVDEMSGVVYVNEDEIIEAFT